MAGISAEHIMVDPGIGFGKTQEDSMRLLKYLSEFKVLGRPIVTGPSRKAFIGKITGGAPDGAHRGYCRCSDSRHHEWDKYSAGA